MLFFVLSSADHRDLHSFPTRRSSDLVLGDEDFAHPAARQALDEQVAAEHLGKARIVPTERSAQRTGIRSEEHTSELQSRVDLVCRLLLEKKKKQKPTAKIRSKHRIGC